MRKYDLATYPVNKLVMKYMVPSIAAMLGLSACIFFDTLFVGMGVGDMGIAGLNIAVPIYNFYNSIGYLLGIGGATTMSIAIGREEHNKVNFIFTLSILFSIIIAMLFTLGGLFIINPICRFLGASEEILPLVKQYLRTIMIASPLFIVSITLNVFVRNDKAPKLAMAAIILGNISNIIFDYIFIIPLKMGMMGAALATVTAPIVSILVLITHFTRQNNTVKLNFSKLNFEPTFKIFNNGVSSLVMELSAGLIIFAFNLTVFSIKGEIGVSAYGIIANLAMIVTAIFYGMSQAIQPVLSYNHGAQNNERIKETFSFAKKIALVSGVFFLIIVSLFAKELTGLFTKDKGELFINTTKGLRIYFIAFIFAGTNILTITFFQSIEQSKNALIISTLRGIALVMVLLLILPRNFGIDGVWMTIPLAELMTFIVSIILVRTYEVKHK